MTSEDSEAYGVEKEVKKLLFYSLLLDFTSQFLDSRGEGQILDFQDTLKYVQDHTKIESE